MFVKLQYDDLYEAVVQVASISELDVSFVYSRQLYMLSQKRINQ